MLRRSTYNLLGETLGDTQTGMASWIGAIVGGDLYQWHDKYWLHLVPDAAVIEEIRPLPMPFISDPLTRIMASMYVRTGLKVPAFGASGAIRRDVVADSGTGTTMGLPWVAGGMLPATQADADALTPPPADVPKAGTTVTLPGGSTITLPPWWPYAAAGVVGVLLLTR